MKKKKLSSYQKLKQKNLELLNDIHILIRNKGGVKAAMTEGKYTMREDIVTHVLFGSRYGIEKAQKKMEGIIPQITKKTLTK